MVPLDAVRQRAGQLRARVERQLEREQTERALLTVPRCGAELRGIHDGLDALELED